MEGSKLVAAAADAAAGQQYPAAALYVVATPIGNLADLTLRALHVLALVDAIACEDTRHSAALLRHFGDRQAADRGARAQRARRRRRACSPGSRRGERVAYVSDAGTPAVSDPGAALVAAARAAGYRVVPIPGASSALAALSVAGDAGSAGFAFVGFLAARGSERAQAPGRVAARAGDAGRCSRRRTGSSRSPTRSPRPAPSDRRRSAASSPSSSRRSRRCRRARCRRWLARRPEPRPRRVRRRAARAAPRPTPARAPARTTRVLAPLLARAAAEAGGRARRRDLRRAAQRALRARARAEGRGAVRRTTPRPSASLSGRARPRRRAARADVRARLVLHALELAALARRDDAVGLGLRARRRGSAPARCSSRRASRRLSWPQATPASMRAC